MPVIGELDFIASLQLLLSPNVGGCRLHCTLGPAIPMPFVDEHLIFATLWEGIFVLNA